MADTFDPYREWLGIEPHERPLHHYRLLGLAPFDRDAARIAQAAESRMTEVRKWQHGIRARESQRVLTELAQAKLCLLDPARRARYDEQLQAVLEGRAAATALSAGGMAASSYATPAPHAAPRPAPQPAPQPASVYPAPAAAAPWPAESGGEGDLPPWVLPVCLSGAFGTILLLAGFLLVRGMFAGDGPPAEAPQVAAAPVPPPDADSPATKSADPESTDPNGTDPNPADPKAADPKGDDLASATPKTSGGANSPPAPGPPPELWSEMLAVALGLAPPPEAVAGSLPPVPGPSDPSDAIVTGQTSDWAGTTGLQGELKIRGQATRVLLRYRLGATLEADAIDRKRGLFGLPGVSDPSTPQRSPSSLFPFSIRLEGRLEVLRATRVRFSQAVWGGNTNSLQTNLILDGAEYRGERVFASDNYTNEYALTPGVYMLAWDLRSAPGAEWRLWIAADDPAAIVVGYSPRELQLAQSQTPKGEILVAANLLRTTGARRVLPPAPAASGPPMGSSATDPPPATTTDPALPGPALLPRTLAAEPAADVFQTAWQRVEQRYMQLLADADSADKQTALVFRLRDEAKRTADLPTRYALFRQAVLTAGASGDIALVDGSLLEMQQYFHLAAPADLQTSAYRIMPLSLAPLPTLARGAQRLFDLAAAEGRRGNAKQAVELLTIARDLAEKTGDARLLNTVDDLLKVLQGRQTRDGQVSNARATIARRPDDSDANFTLGVDAVSGDDWIAGMAYFRKTQKLHLHEVALMETNAAQQGLGMIDIGDRWWTAATAPELRGDSGAEFQFKRRAVAWYHLGKSLASPAVARRLQARLAEFDMQFAVEIDAASPLVVVTPQPGIVLRCVAPQGPTPYYGVLQGRQNLAQLEQAVRNRVSLSVPLQWLGVGCIVIRSKQPAQVTLHNCRLIMANNGQRHEIRGAQPQAITFPPGLSLIRVEASGPNAQIDIRDPGAPPGTWALGHLNFQMTQVRDTPIPDGRGNFSRSELVVPAP